MDKYILFGAGHDGLLALQFLGENRVQCFCDNHKAGNSINGKVVISTEELLHLYDKYKVVITTTKGKNMAAIAMQLHELAIPFLFLSDVMDEYIRRDAIQYDKLNKRANLRYDAKYDYFIPLDKVANAGELGSYFWQDLWAAKHIHNKKPLLHVDIGSRIDGFIAHLLSFGQKTRLLDIRPLESTITGLEFLQCDATNMEGIEDASIESLSALCSLEHFGLGRYGDPLDPEACFKCFSAIQKKMKRDGIIYISVPIGKEHLEYNAHRVFFAHTIQEAFSKMEMLEFSAAYNDIFEADIDLHKYDMWDNRGGERFGLFMFRKV